MYTLMPKKSWIRGGADIIKDIVTRMWVKLPIDSMIEAWDFSEPLMNTVSVYVCLH